MQPGETSPIQDYRTPTERGGGVAFAPSRMPTLRIPLSGGDVIVTVGSLTQYRGFRRVFQVTDY
ncbi:hypothetical protein HMPREF0201_03118 [Cedecea davisae DSM 4568]|uniref:Uncharacterized protein n=1 Tax=Cedecea davisae DSM 4568 TaxID=566551 RepID=S3ITQ8_9ENTR|nr:hypothetical protein HMPREF0201_03118 [Cedecea davisae DSM 4568]